jgi:predicted nuclease of predicted toxin-antitoxin system
LNFIADAQLPPALARWIESQGHSAEHVFEMGLASAADPLIWERAKASSAIIISKDEDFVDRWLLRSEGVRLVWIRKGNCSNAAPLAWLSPLWPNTLKRLQEGEQFIELRA